MRQISESIINPNWIQTPANKESSWLLPNVIGGVEVFADSGVIQFQIGVPVDCVFDEVQLLAFGVLVEPLQLKSGLQTVYLHFFDLFKNSIVVGELRVVAVDCTQLIPFHLIVRELTSESFEHRQYFSEDDKERWGVETDETGNCMWVFLCNDFMAQMAELNRRIQQRPCTRGDLKNIGVEFDNCLALLQKKREKLRSRNSFLSDPPNFGSVVHCFRATLRKVCIEHEKAVAHIVRLRNLTNRGHIKMAVSQAPLVRTTIKDFSDLNLDFVEQAEVQYRIQRRRLLTLGGVGAAVFFLVYLIVKYLNG